MNWIAFIVIAVIVAAIGGVLGGWILPAAGLEPGLARIIGFGLAGAVIAIVFIRMRGLPRA